MMRMLRALFALSLLAAQPVYAQGVGQLGSGQLWGNATASRAPAGPTTVTAILDRALTGVQGCILNRNATVFVCTRTPTLGLAGTAAGTLIFENATSGTITVTPPTGALGTRVLTLPVATDTLVGKATADIFTNKTYDTAGTGNSFSINGLAATANTGTGAVVRASSPALVTPDIGAATATSINGNTITTGTGTLTIAAGKTLTVSNTLTFTGSDGTSFAFPSVSGTVMTLGGVQTVTGVKTFADATLLLGGLTSGTLTQKAAAIAGTNTLTWPAGTTDFSGTGGASQVVKQVSAGAAFTVARLACADLSDASSGCSAASGITALTGDATATGPGSSATTLATVNSNVGSFGSSTSIPTITVNAKGLTTAASGNAVVAPAGTLTGATLASNVLASSLTSVGTLTGGATGAGFTVALTTSTITGTLTVPNGGTGVTTLTGLALGNGASAFSAYTGTVCGGGQFVTELNASGASTCSTPAGGGDFIGPASSTDNAAVRFDSTTGKIGQNSALIIADTTGSLSRTGNGGIPVQGTNTNDAAATGYIGEYITSQVLAASKVGLTTNTTANITSISLTAGDWEVSGAVVYDSEAATSVTAFEAGWNTTSAADATRGAGRSSVFFLTTAIAGISVALNGGPSRLSLSATTTVYLVARSIFTVSTLAAYGDIRARRVR